MEYAIYLALFLPLISALTIMTASKHIGRFLTGTIACGAILISFIIFASVLVHYESNSMDPLTFTLYNWIPVDKIYTDFSLRVDPLSLLMTLIITGVGFLIHLYSNGYMDHDKDYARFFAYMNFFVFSMLLLVLAANLLLLFVGWEGVGLASYLLIGFWYDRSAPPPAATKAFVVNRIGDLGLLLGILLTYYVFGTSNIAEVSASASTQFAVGAPILMILTLLYFVGAAGKSAQLPLHVWLPDAMEGPTPVSALIHAATMVTAGVYLVVRMHPVFMMAPWTLHLIGAIGGTTALFASLCAVAQTDLKRVLAYSTVSQLGLMFLACGVGAFYAAMFHLTTHAFIKATLFLSAGNVVHMMHGNTDMGKMGGLSKVFTKTHWLFLIGVLALSGIPPLSAFFSKDLILEQEYATGFFTLFYVGLAASILTAFYLTRAYCLTFMGQPHEEKTHEPIKEAPSIMVLPVSILALLSIIGGFFGFSFGKAAWLESLLAEVGVTLAPNTQGGISLLSFETILAVLGGISAVVLAAILYTRYVDQLGSPITLLRKSFYIDEIYERVFVRPLKALARFIANILEPSVFDGSIKVATKGVQSAARGLQLVQSGQIRSYVAWMVVGMVALLAYLAF